MDWMWDVRECVKDGFEGFSLSNQMNRGVIYRDGKLQGRMRLGGDEGRRRVALGWAKYEDSLIRQALKLPNKQLNRELESQSRVDSRNINLGGIGDSI